MTKPINFYFDFLSPYSFFAFKRRHILKDLNINYLPVPMGSLFSYWQFKGPGMIKPKREYMLRQCFIYAAKNNIRFIPPKAHPFNPLYALRLSSRFVAKQDQEKIIELLFDAAWSEGLDIGQDKVLIDLLNRHNLDGQMLLDKTFEKDAKQEIKKNLADAKASQVFGVPSFTFQEQLYWGNDQLDELISDIEGRAISWDEQLFIQRINQADMVE